MVTAIRQSMAVVDEAMRGQRDIFPTRWPRLNRQLLGGLQPKKLYVVAGRPGSGKSAFSNQLVFDVLDLARIAGKRVVVFYWSFEMPGYQQILRYAAKDTGKSLSDLYSVDVPLSKASFDAYAKSVTSYARFPIFFQNRPRSIAYIEDATAKYLALNPDIYLINLIDHSRLLEEDKVDEEMKKLNLLSKGCMRMQAEHDKCLTILLSQLNRNIEQPERAKAQYQPLLTDLFGGDSIGQDKPCVTITFAQTSVSMATPQHVMEAVRLRRTAIKMLSRYSTNAEISDALGISIKTVRSDLWRMRCRGMRRTEQKLPLTEEFKQLILGSMLGDGHLKKGCVDNHACRFSVSHSPAQKEYLLFKKTLIDKVIASKMTYNVLRSSRYKRGFVEEFRLTTLGSSYFTELQRQTYVGKSGKGLPPNVHELSSLGLAIWFMDDGMKCSHGYRIATNSFTLEELKVLQDILWSNFGIHSSVHKRNLLYIPAKSRDLFSDLIRTSLPPNMLSYKLHQCPV
jgi:hypothetical protein